MIIPSIKHLPSKQTRVFKNSRKFHLVYTEGRDYGYCDPNKLTYPAVAASLNPEYEEWKTFTNENWVKQIYRKFMVINSSQHPKRKGQKFYRARTGDDMIQGVKNLAYNETDKCCRMRMDIVFKGDSWVPEGKVAGEYKAYGK